MKETFYFSHDYGARNDEKIIKLIQKEGWEGYGLYWAIIEKLYEADGFLEEDYDCIAFDLRTDCDRITRVVNDYNLFVVASNKIHSKSCLARLKRRKGISEQNRQNAILRWNKQKKKDTTALRPQSERNASKVKESKVKNIYISVLNKLSQEVKNKTAPSLLEKFSNYWDQKVSYKGQKMAYWQKVEKQKAFDFNKRLATFKKNQEERNYQNNQRFVKVDEKPQSRNVSRGTSGMSLIGDIINK